jgi:CDP-diacylglycerol--glycerol-3-phosphate 3-phosphatidyltransferase
VQLGRAEAYLAIIIIGREIAISALREWMAQLGKTKNVAVAFIGKVKTASQMTAIIALLLYEPLGVLPTALLGTIALWVAAILTLWSMFHYLRLAAPYLRGVDGMTELRNTVAKARESPPA